MATQDISSTLEDILRLAAFFQSDWRPQIEALRGSGTLVGLDDADDADEDVDDDRDDDDSRDDVDAGDRDDDDGDDRDDDDDVEDDDEGDRRPVDWKRHSRRHERREKQLARENAELRSQLDKVQKRSKTQQQRDVDDARRRGEQEAEQRYTTLLRANSLESAITVAAARGFDIEVEGEDGKKVKERVGFADSDDALLHIQRMIRSGDLDEEDLFDRDGRIKKAAVNDALTEILEEKKHLRSAASSTRDRKKKAGSSDAGRGKGGAKPLEEMTPEEHLRALQKK